MKVNNISISNLQFTYKYTYEISFRSYYQFFFSGKVEKLLTEMVARKRIIRQTNTYLTLTFAEKKERKKEGLKEKHFDSG